MPKRKKKYDFTVYIEMYQNERDKERGKGSKKLWGKYEKGKLSCTKKQKKLYFLQLFFCESIKKKVILYIFP